MSNGGWLAHVDSVAGQDLVADAQPRCISIAAGENTGDDKRAAADRGPRHAEPRGVVTTGGPVANFWPVADDVFRNAAGKEHNGAAGEHQEAEEAPGIMGSWGRQ